MEELKIGSHTLRSRLIVGTGKYKDLTETKAALEASGADMVTVAVRRLDTAKSRLDRLVSKNHATPRPKRATNSRH